MTFDTQRCHRQYASFQFQAASVLANRNGMTLEQRTRFNYTLRGIGWEWSIYPGTQRLYSSDDNKPYLDVTRPWTLLDVVKASVDSIAKGTEA